MTTMKTTLAAALLTLFAAGSASAAADPVYGHAGHVNGATYTFEAVATADVYAYFLSESAAYTETLGMATADSTTPLGLVGLDNQTTSRGTRIDLGHVTAGEVVTFFIEVANTGLVFSSQISENKDDTQHVYSTTFAGGGTMAKPLPEGTFISFEDLTTTVSDHDYNDTAFVVTNVMAVPEPGSVALMLAGLALVGFKARRRGH